LLSAAALAALAFAPAAQAQDNWPQRQVTIVVPFSAGGTTDMFARILAQGLQQKYGTPFIIENRAGAGGNIGALAVSRAAKDGYTLLVGTVSTHAINPFIYKNLQHDTQKDFQPVSLIARLPNMLVVNPKIPANTRRRADRSSEEERGQAQLRLLGRGNLDASCLRAVSAQNQHQDGACAIPQLGRRDERADGPAGTPLPIIEKLAGEVKRIFEAAEVQKNMAEVGAVPSPMTPEQFSGFIAAERRKWQEVVQAAGVQMQ